MELAGRTEAVPLARAEHGQSERTACKLLGVERSSYRYEPRPNRNAELREEVVTVRGRSHATATIGVSV